MDVFPPWLDTVGSLNACIFGREVYSKLLDIAVSAGRPRGDELAAFDSLLWKVVGRLAGGDGMVSNTVVYACLAFFIQAVALKENLMYFASSMNVDEKEVVERLAKDKEFEREFMRRLSVVLHGLAVCLEALSREAAEGSWASRWRCWAITIPAG